MNLAERINQVKGLKIRLARLKDKAKYINSQLVGFAPSRRVLSGRFFYVYKHPIIKSWYKMGKISLRKTREKIFKTEQKIKELENA